MGIYLLRREGGGERKKKWKNHCTKNIIKGLEYHGGIYRKTQVSNSLASVRNSTKRKEKLDIGGLGILSH